MASVIHFPGSHKGPQRQARLLLVEDVVLIAVMLEQSLEEDGFFVVTAEDGRAALDAVAQARASGDPFDVAVVDLGLPDMPGSEVIRSIRDASAFFPVVVVTAYADGTGEDGCQGQLGTFSPVAFAILPKPIDLANLRATIRRVRAQAIASAA